MASSGKTDITKVGLNSIENEVVKANLMGKSRVMNKKGWVDSQGRKGKGYGVYKVRLVFVGAALSAERFFPPGPAALETRRKTHPSYQPQNKPTHNSSPTSTAPTSTATRPSTPLTCGARAATRTAWAPRA